MPNEKENPGRTPEEMNETIPEEVPNKLNKEYEDKPIPERNKNNGDQNQPNSSYSPPQPSRGNNTSNIMM